METMANSMEDWHDNKIVSDHLLGADSFAHFPHSDFRAGK
jgi:hypothetical protein